MYHFLFRIPVVRVIFRYGNGPRPTETPLGMCFGKKKHSNPEAPVDVRVTAAVPMDDTENTDLHLRVKPVPTAVVKRRFGKTEQRNPDVPVEVQVTASVPKDDKEITDQFRRLY